MAPSDIQATKFGLNSEIDPCWEAVDDYTASHLLSTPAPHIKPGALEHAIATSKASNLPNISVSPAQGKFLALLCRLAGAKNVLELGTLGAYSTIWLATAGPDVRITTVEVDEEHAVLARKNLDYAGLADRVEMTFGFGADVVPTIEAQVRKGERPKFGFVFIDADKENNWAYFDSSVEMCETGACIIVDNVVWAGDVANEELVESDEGSRGSREVIEKAGKDERVDAVVMQTVGRKSHDGFLMAVVK